MADLIKQVQLVQIATIRKSDLEQIDHCLGLHLSDIDGYYQQEAGKDRRELVVIGWFKGNTDKRILVQRVDDGRLLQAGIFSSEGEQVAMRSPQLFLR